MGSRAPHGPKHSRPVVDLGRSITDRLVVPHAGRNGVGLGPGGSTETTSTCLAGPSTANINNIIID